MSPKLIKPGHTYVNKGKGNTLRRVVAIGDEHRPRMFWNGTNTHPDDTGVLFSRPDGSHDNLYLKSFAAWCGKDLTEMFDAPIQG